MLRGALRHWEFVRFYRPKHIAGARRTAISWTTTASVASVIEMVCAPTGQSMAASGERPLPARFCGTVTALH